MVTLRVPSFLYPWADLSSDSKDREHLQLIPRQGPCAQHTAGPTLSGPGRHSHTYWPGVSTRWVTTGRGPCHLDPRQQQAGSHLAVGGHGLNPGSGRHGSADVAEEAPRGRGSRNRRSPGPLNHPSSSEERASRQTSRLMGTGVGPPCCAASSGAGGAGTVVRGHGRPTSPSRACLSTAATEEKHRFPSQCIWEASRSSPVFRCL